MKCQTEIHYQKEVLPTEEKEGPSFMVSYFIFPTSDLRANQRLELGASDRIAI